MYLFLELQESSQRLLLNFGRLLVRAADPVGGFGAEHRHDNRQEAKQQKVSPGRACSQGSLHSSANFGPQLKKTGMKMQGKKRYRGKKK